MTTSLRTWPSPGFGLLVAVHLAVGAFLVWGLLTPRLELADRVLRRMDSDGFDALRADEVALLRDTLRRHSGFARALGGKATATIIEPTPDGWSTRVKAHGILRASSAKPDPVTLEVRGQRELFPIRFALTGPGVPPSLEFTSPQAQSFEWDPGGTGGATLIDIRVELSPNASTASRSSLKYRLLAQPPKPPQSP